MFSRANRPAPPSITAKPASSMFPKKSDKFVDFGVTNVRITAKKGKKRARGSDDDDNGIELTNENCDRDAEILAAKRELESMTDEQREELLEFSKEDIVYETDAEDSEEREQQLIRRANRIERKLKSRRLRKKRKIVMVEEESDEEDDSEEYNEEEEEDEEMSRTTTPTPTQEEEEEGDDEEDEEKEEEKKKIDPLPTQSTEYWLDAISSVNTHPLDLLPPVMYQEDAVNAVKGSLEDRAFGILPRNRPHTLFFTGPSGHGKTALANRVGKTFFSEERLNHNAFLCINLSVCVDKLDSARLFGATAGTEGCSGGKGVLVEFLDNLPEREDFFDGAIEFAEADKAHPAVVLQLMQLIDEGSYTNATTGVQKTRPNILIIFTSNAGESIERESSVKLSTRKLNDLVVEEITNTVCAGHHSLMGRIGDPVLFRVFTNEQCAEIAKKTLLLRGEGMCAGAKREGDRFVISKEDSELITDFYVRPEQGLRSMEKFYTLVRVAYRDVIREGMRNAENKKSVTQVCVTVVKEDDEEEEPRVTLTCV